MAGARATIIDARQGRGSTLENAAPDTLDAVKLRRSILERLDGHDLLVSAWINRYSKYWDNRFKTLADNLLEIERRRA